jgi:2',3'-cyclic-nucleotide 2'-phosphodiesterase (5'-nucleotidase family)
VIKQQRHSASHVLVLDAGDSLMGDRTPARTSQGKSSVELMNRMGYDAMALGEGDLSKLDLNTIQQRIQEADFPILSANVLVTGTGELLTEPYVIRQMGEHGIAIIGLTGMAELPGIEIRDPLEAAREVVAQVRERADILILLSHAGLAVNHEIGKAIAEIDLIVSGGGGSVVSSPQSSGSGPVIVHADAASPGHAGRRIGVGTWSFDAGGELTAQRWENLSLEPTFRDDPDMLAWIEANP